MWELENFWTQKLFVSLNSTTFVLGKSPFEQVCESWLFHLLNVFSWIYGIGMGFDLPCHFMCIISPSPQALVIAEFFHIFRICLRSFNWSRFVVWIFLDLPNLGLHFKWALSQLAPIAAPVPSSTATVDSSSLVRRAPIPWLVSNLKPQSNPSFSEKQQK